MNYPKITATHITSGVDTGLQNEDFSVDVSYKHLKECDYIVGINIITPQKRLRKEKLEKIFGK